MSNPVVLIPGALTGIGRGAALAFAKKGAKVVIAGSRGEARRSLKSCALSVRRQSSPTLTLQKETDHG
jgi:NAD(P)-dependent dehydrogenase (short-subunit alcohol dehydrogenase family)